MDEQRITRLSVQKKHPDRVNVYLNGEFAFGLYRDTAAWLEVGQILSDEKIRELTEADIKAEAYKKALDFIAFKPRTVRETEVKLQSLGYDESLTAETLTRLTESGLLDDEYFAERWIEERSRIKHKSTRALIYELRRKGIPDHLIQSAVEDADDLRSACELAESRLYRFEGLSKPEFRAKMWNFLAGKGFSSDVISEVTRKIWEDISTSANDQ